MAHGHRMPDFPIVNLDPETADRFGREDLKGSDWKKLARGMPLGKSINIIWDHTDPNDPPRTSNLPMIQLEGPDDAAMNMCVTLGPPKIFKPAGSLVGLDIDRLQGPFYDNNDILGSASFNGFKFVQALATIEWGTLGAQHKAEIDFDDGATINVSGSFVRVYARLKSNELQSSQAVYQLAACVSQGWGRSHGSKRTDNFLVPGGAAPQFSSVFAIPRFAKSVNVNGADSLAPDAGNLFSGIIRFWNAPNGPALGGVAAVATAFFSGNQHDSVPIPSGAYYYDVQTDGASAWNVSAKFTLNI